MSVSPSKGIYKCFSCGVGGDALNFLVRIQNREYKDVILELAEKSIFNITERNQTTSIHEMQEVVNNTITLIEKRLANRIHKRFASLLAEMERLELSRQFPSLRP